MMGPQKNSFLLDMIDQIDLFITFRTFFSIKSVIDNWAVEPGRVINGGESWRIRVIDLFGEIVSFV